MGGACVTGSKGSEGSKGLKGSKGGGIAFGDEFYSQRYGIYFMSPVLHDEEPKPPSQGREVAP